MPKGVFMAIDWGEKRMGLAVGQAITGHARGVAVIKAKAGIPQWSLVQQWIKKFQPEAVILGLPLLLDGKEQPLTERVREFAPLLAEQVALPIYWVEEQLSSAEAADRCDDPTMLDAEAAAVILETWLSMSEPQRQASRYSLPIQEG